MERIYRVNFNPRKTSKQNEFVIYSGFWWHEFSLVFAVASLQL